MLCGGSRPLRPLPSLFPLPLFRRTFFILLQKFDKIYIRKRNTKGDNPQAANSFNACCRIKHNKRKGKQMSVPNQNIIIIHKEYPEKDFLQVKNESWKNVLKGTKEDYAALALYLYLASNMNNYRLELSPQAIQNAIGMPRSTYYKKMKILKDNGYIIERQGNLLEFYETPQEQSVRSGLPEKQQNLSAAQQNPQQRQDSLPQKQNLPQRNIEIDNKYIDNTHNTDITTKSRKVNAFIF